MRPAPEMIPVLIDTAKTLKAGQRRLFMAIDIEASISRAMTAIASDAQQRKANQLKQMLSRYQRNRDLISVGAYAQGHDVQLDRAVGLYPHIERFLQQRIDDRASVDETLHGLSLLFPGN